MDFLKLIRSFGDLLFEVLSWIVYYPRTLWLVLRNPLMMIDYSNHEQRDSEEDQYTDTLSPPILLLLTLLLLHLLEVGTGTVQQIQAADPTIRSLVNSDQNIVLLRSFLFALLPLFAAVNYVRKRKLPFERDQLKPPFFGQCYLAAVFALLLSLAAWLGHIGWAFGVAGSFAGTAWYITVQTLQNRRALNLGPLRALGSALWIVVEAFACLLVIAILIAGGIS